MNPLTSSEKKTGSVFFIMCAAVLFFDYFTPLGVADGMLYALLLLQVSFARSRRLLIAAVSLSSVLVITGLLISRPLIVPWVVLMNRALSLIVIAGMGAIIYRSIGLQLKSEQYQQQLLIEQEKLKQSNEELEIFAHTVAHDLRNPLRVMRSFGQILLEDYASVLDKTATDYVKRIAASADTLNSMIISILNLSSVSRKELKKQFCDLSAIARSVIDDLSFNEPERKVTTSIKEGITAYCDPELIRVVLMNLLGNAWKFTRHVQSPLIEFGESDQRGETIYYVRDNGAGFNIDHGEKLFMLFHRLHSDKEFEGTGAGLATVKRIINRHEGKIWASGETGKGATFSFTLGSQ